MKMTICMDIWICNPPACRRVLWILLVRSCTVCLVFCLCLDFPLGADFCLVELQPTPPPPPSSSSSSSSGCSSSSFATMCWAQLCPRLAQRALGFEHVCCYCRCFCPPFWLCLPPVCCVVSFVQYLHMHNLSTHGLFPKP